MMKCEKQMMMLKQIQEIGFVQKELQLYLDTHPCDTEALNDYNCATQAFERLNREYTREFGSLFDHGFHGCEEWTWIDCPWPWEM